jgi:hypothetical protein
VLGAIQQERLTMFFGVPTIFINLLAIDLSAWTSPRSATR